PPRPGPAPACARAASGAPLSQAAMSKPQHPGARFGVGDAERDLMANEHRFFDATSTALAAGTLVPFRPPIVMTSRQTLVTATAGLGCPRPRDLSSRPASPGLTWQTARPPAAAARAARRIGSLATKGGLGAGSRPAGCQARGTGGFTWAGAHDDGAGGVRRCDRAAGMLAPGGIPRRRRRPARSRRPARRAACPVAGP